MEHRPDQQIPTTEAKARVLDALASGSDAVGAAESAGVDANAVRRWLDSDPEFIASLNRARLERAGRLRAEVRELASDAVATLREIISDSEAPPAVRLRASLAILQSADAMKAETIGPTDPQAIRSELSQRELFASLGV